MNDHDLTQDVADALIRIKKRAISKEKISVPHSGRVEVPLIDHKEQEKFQLDVRRARIELQKGTNQMRTRKTIILVRLDFGGAPHRNPNGAEIPCPHIHLYKEGFGDKWAFPLPEGRFLNINDFRKTLEDFLKYCNVTGNPFSVQENFW
ncbi:MAG: hypothetical protein GDA52_06755 [Rhodobacteraceae bacterium]|nr:hypothetical protein [Paracoccaceae bacterium]